MAATAPLPEMTRRRNPTPSNVCYPTAARDTSPTSGLLLLFVAGAALPGARDRADGTR